MCCYLILHLLIFVDDYGVTDIMLSDFSCHIATLLQLPFVISMVLLLSRHI